MIEYIDNEIAKNIKGMSEMIGVDESKYWYFAGKVEALSLLKKEMESKPKWVAIKRDHFDFNEMLNDMKKGVAVIHPEEVVYVDTDDVYDKCSLYPPVMKDERNFRQRFKDIFPLRG